MSQSKQTELGDRLDLSSYLLSPVQRLGRYILLLRALQREERAETEAEGLPTAISQLPTAITHLEHLMDLGNNLIALDSITNCTVSTSINSPHLSFRALASITSPSRTF